MYTCNIPEFPIERLPICLLKGYFKVGGQNCLAFATTRWQLQFFFYFCSSYQGWDNPFRPEGELSHDAEEILRLWKDGKLKDFSLLLKASSSNNNNSADMDKADEVDNTTTTTQ